jgi:hypothetical protein
MLMGMVCPIKISSFLPHTPAKIPLVKCNSNIEDADFSFSYQDLTFFITKAVSNHTKGKNSAGCSSELCKLRFYGDSEPSLGFALGDPSLDLLLAGVKRYYTALDDDRRC